MPTTPRYRAFSDAALAHGPYIDAATDDAAIAVARAMTEERPVRVYRLDPHPSGGVDTVTIHNSAVDAPPTTAPAPEAAPAPTAPRTTRKVCRRPGCGVDTAQRYYVHTAPGSRALWCGACVRSHATTIAGGERWASSSLVTDVRGRRRSPASVVGMAICDHCQRPGDRESIGVFCDAAGGLTTTCQQCIGDRDQGHTRSMPSDYMDTDRVCRWIDDRHPDAIRVTTSPYGDTQWQFRGTISTVRECPGCGTYVDAHRVTMPLVDVVAPGGIGPSHVRVCPTCHGHTRTDGDDVAAYHHTTNVHPVRVDGTAVVRDDTIGASHTDVRGDRGYAGRIVVVPAGYSTRRHTRRAPWLAGLEVELASVGETSPGQIARYCRETWGALWAESKADSSIMAPRGRGGVEVVSHPGTIGAFRATFANWKAPPGAEANASCGMHIHVSRDALSPGQIDRICYLMSRRGDVATWSRVFRRDPNTYCRTYSPGSFARRRWRDEAEKYRVLNITPRHTIEFRWPASTVRGDVVLATVEIIHAMCIYTSPGNPGGSHTAAALSWSAFVAWMQSDPYARSETRTARVYLAARGLISPRKPRPGLAPRVDDGTDATIDPSMVGGLAARPGWAMIPARV